MRRNYGRVLGIAWNMYPDGFTRNRLVDYLETCFSQVEEHRQFLMEKYYFHFCL